MGARHAKSNAGDHERLIEPERWATMDVMTTTLLYPEQRVVLENISWSLYEELLDAQQNRRAPRFTYDRGALEIMSPSAEHEQIVYNITLLVALFAEVKGINIQGLGSTTFRRKDLSRGFEPDACFYRPNLHRVNKNRIDLAFDPPPDLVIEIDIASSSIDKASIAAEVAVPELWRYDKNGWRIFILDAGVYVEDQSKMLPGLTRQLITELMEESRTLNPLPWMARVREIASLVK